MNSKKQTTLRQQLLILILLWSYLLRLTIQTTYNQSVLSLHFAAMKLRHYAPRLTRITQRTPILQMTRAKMIEDQTLPELMTENGTKPKRGRPRKNPDLDTGSLGASSEKKGRPALEKQIEEIKYGLSGLFGGVGKLVANFDQFDGMVIQGGAPDLIDALCRAARKDGRLRGWLLSMVHVSAYSDIALYASMMLVPILIHHNIIPASLFSSMFVADEQDSGD